MNTTTEKTSRLNVRLTPEEHAAVKARATDAGLATSEYVRRCALIAVCVALLYALVKKLQRPDRNVNRSVQPDKAYIRQHIRQHVRQRVAEIGREAPDGNRMRELSQRLEKDGVKMTVSKSGKQVNFQREGSPYKVSGSRLGRGYSMAGLAKGLGMGAGIYLTNAASRDMDR